MRWDEVDDCEPEDFTIFTMPERFAEIGDLHADIDDHVFDIAPLLEWADRDEAQGRRAAGRARNRRKDAPRPGGSARRLASRLAFDYVAVPWADGRADPAARDACRRLEATGFRLPRRLRLTEAGLRAGGRHRVPAYGRTAARGVRPVGSRAGPGARGAGRHAPSSLLAWLWDCRYATFTTSLDDRHRRCRR